MCYACNPPRDGEREFHIETRRENGQWRRFTENPILDKGRAEAHVQQWMSLIPPEDRDTSRIRIREVTDDDRKAELLAKHRDAFDKHLMSRSLNDLRGIVEGTEDPS